MVGCGCHISTRYAGHVVIAMGGESFVRDEWVLRCMKGRIRELLRAMPFQPFVIRMADGREHRVDHPDFVLAPSSDVPQITIEEPDGRQHCLSALLITAVERSGDPGSHDSQAA